MEYKAKYNVGDIVYSKKCPEYGAMQIDSIVITDTADGCRVVYWAIYGEDRLRDYCLEQDLSTEKPIPKPKSVYGLKDGYGLVYALRMYGDVYEFVFNNSDYARVVEQGNVFLTWEEAEKEAKRRKIHQQLKKLAGEYKFKPNEDNYYIYYDYICDVICWNHTHRYKESGIVYFETEKDAKNAIKEIGKEVLLRDYFGIDEE